MKIQVLGVCASPRRGNSQFLLDAALEAARGTLPDSVAITSYSLRGKKFEPCLNCQSCHNKTPGMCVLKDSFEELRQLWIAADVVLYSVPVYHAGIPGQLKCFIDRLGQSFYRYYSVPSTRHLKVVGAIAQGAHMYGGQELAIGSLLQHAVLLNCLPVSGDGWESYLGVGGWTLASDEAESMQRNSAEGERDALVSLSAARSLGRRAVHLAAIVKSGAEHCRQVLEADPKYDPLLNRLSAEEGRQSGRQ